MRPEWYLQANGYVRNRRTGDYLHRILMKATKGQIVDHINRNRIDNRSENLRIVDGTGNNLNRQPGKSKSGITGVRKRNVGHTWIARIGLYGKEVYLGDFKTKQEAVVARRQAEKRYWKCAL